MTLGDYYRHAPLAKPEPRRRVKARAQRAEAKQLKSVRAMCVERDGECRACLLTQNDHITFGAWLAPHGGPSELAHMHGRRRSKTRGMAPEIRHDTKHCLMLCRKHHQDYDAKKLIITAQSRRGADGPLTFRRAK